MEDDVSTVFLQYEIIVLLRMTGGVLTDWFCRIAFDVRKSYKLPVRAICGLRSHVVTKGAIVRRRVGWLV